MGFPSRTEGKERGATARLQFRNAPFPAGPDFVATYRMDGDEAIRGSMVCKFLEDVSIGGMVSAHVWTHGPSIDIYDFVPGRNFKLMIGGAVIADCTMMRGPPAALKDPPFVSTSGLPFDL